MIKINKKEQYKSDKQAPLILFDSVTRVLVPKLHNRSMKMINNKTNKRKEFSKTIHVFENNKKDMNKLLTPICHSFIYKGVYGVTI